MYRDPLTGPIELSGAVGMTTQETFHCLHCSNPVNPFGVFLAMSLMTNQIFTERRITVHCPF